MPKISVIIPTYNRVAALSRAVDSVLRQKGAEIEILIVDDGSTDGTRDWVGDLPVGARRASPLQMTFKYFYQPNRGPAAARNLGIQNARGKFIAFLDSDDEWLPGKLQAQLKFFEENPDYSICQTEEIWIRNGRRVNPMKKHKKYGGWIFEKCLPLCIVSPSAVMMRREFFDRVGLFDESLPACEDYDLWLRTSAQMPIGLVTSKGGFETRPYVIKYGGHADQRSRQFEAMDRFRIYALRKILDSGLLNATQRQAALEELQRKTEIVTRGAEKRRGSRNERLAGPSPRAESDSQALEILRGGLGKPTAPPRLLAGNGGRIPRTARLDFLRGIRLRPGRRVRPLFKPEKIYIEKDAEGYPFTQALLSRVPKVPSEIIEDKKSFLKKIQNEPDPIGAGKRYLLLSVDRGRAFKPFPVPKGTVSCDFHSLHLIEGCDLECSYCILQAYLTNPLLTIYVNLEEILENLESFLKSHLGQTFRIGTGQLADSLSLDHLTAHTETLVPFFARQTNGLLELKTKSVNIERLKNLNPQGRTIVSWSMNTKRIQREEEHKCASIEERIAAAKQCVAWGYRVGFHFDPLIDYEGCLEEYEALLEVIFTQIPQEHVAWVSLGTLRFMPKLKSIMEKRFPKSPLPFGEWIRGTDGKLRYFKPRRIELYRHLAQCLERLAPRVPRYLCMETEEIWEKTLGETTLGAFQGKRPGTLALR